MSKQGKEPTAQRFGGEFGPYRKPGTQGVSLSTFKTLVWTSNIGGLMLLVISLELLFVAQQFGWGLLLLVLGVGVALFPSNYEIRGMEDDEEAPPSEGASSVDEGPSDA
tara:strand:- start:8425 stop:8751 length:327 start_codon:yes stop_codon:yes gene_type:complete